MKLSSQEASPYRRILVFGPPKSGKTKLVGSLAAAFDLDWFDLENGVSTLRQLPVEYQERIEVFNIPDTRSFPIAIQTCLKVIKGGEFDICDIHGTISCPLCKKLEGTFTHIDTKNPTTQRIRVFDSLTQLTNSAVAHITKNQPEDYKMEWDDWGSLGKLMDVFLSHLQQAKYHVVCISHETEAEMEDGKQKLVPTAGTRNFSRNAAKYFDEVIYCEVKNKRHVAASSTLYNGNILTGSRSGAVLETDQIADLVPIFTGEVKPKIPSNSENTADSPGNKALTGLKGLSLKK